MSTFQFTGSIVFIGETEQKTDTFATRKLVVNDGGEYAQECLFEFYNDSAALLDSHKVGDEVTVDFNLRGRKWTDPTTKEDKWFNGLNGWRINSGAPETSNSEPVATATATTEEDDLPF